ncbi:MAG: hypothetical protein DME43_02745 [Verrucomicrobia bacterium]|nr:MAG: hypothetical protein DME43_02745 [Verrucomicrobiota bacterium]PYK73429.1 MAG: hypothetical protein DME44_01325 [Verrucomicrobiota bacterium]
MKVGDLPRFGKLVGQIIGLREIEFSHIGSGLSNEKELEDELWQKALTNARRRAERMVKAMGLKIDSVFAISPIGFSEIQRNMLTNEEPIIVTGSNVPPEPEKPSQYRPESVTVTREVHVIYLISSTSSAISTSHF